MTSASSENYGHVMCRKLLKARKSRLKNPPKLDAIKLYVSDYEVYTCGADRKAIWFGSACCKWAAQYYALHEMTPEDDDDTE
jgi:hypothetical protein